MLWQYSSAVNGKPMFKSSVIVSLCLIVMACTSASPKQFYRLSGSEQALEISGSFNQLKFEHIVNINGQTAVSGKLEYNYAPGSFTGQYEGMIVTSDCSWKRKVDLYCLIKIDGESAATLSF
jgi:hypothetical protein